MSHFIINFIDFMYKNVFIRCYQEFQEFINNICFYLVLKSYNKNLVFYLQVFDSNGSFLTFVNTSADPLYGPQGLTVTPEGLVVVGDSGNHCYKVYKYLQ